jgi:PBP1b-binding outer membrane lipoprotein LpoB
MKKLVIVPVLLSVILFLASCSNTDSNASMKAPESEKAEVTKKDTTVQKQAATTAMDTTKKKEKNEKGESEEDEAKEKAEHKSGEKKSVH